MKPGLNKYYYKDIGMVESYYANMSLEFHREDGPACIYSDGAKYWWLNGKKHRLDGPAVDNGVLKQWYIDGELINVKTNEEFLRIVKLKAFL